MQGCMTSLRIHSIKLLSMNACRTLYQRGACFSTLKQSQFFIHKLLLRPPNYVVHCYLSNKSDKNFFRLPDTDGAEAQANRTSIQLQIRGFISFLVGILMCWVYIEYKKGERDEKKKERRKKEMVVHTDPNMHGSAAKLGLHKGCWLPVALFPDDELLDEIWKYPLRTDDVIVCSFPKSGTTWLQEIVYLIMHDVDFEKAKQENMEQRFPYIEYVYPGLKELSNYESPRMLKSHLPYHHLPRQIMEGKSKVLYIARNPKDVVVSYYFFAKMFTEASYSGTIDQFAESFLSGQVPYGPWVIHVREFYEMAGKKNNVFFTTYEDLKEDPEKVISQIAKFLGKKLTSEQVSLIAKHCTFENMKKNPSANYSWWDEYGLRNKNSTPFMRKGEVGDWKNHLSAKMSKDFDMTVKSWLSHSSLIFKDSTSVKK